MARGRRRSRRQRRRAARSGSTRSVGPEADIPATGGAGEATDAAVATVPSSRPSSTTPPMTAAGNAPCSDGCGGRRGPVPHRASSSSWRMGGQPHPPTRASERRPAWQAAQRAGCRRTRPPRRPARSFSRAPGQQLRGLVAAALPETLNQLHQEIRKSGEMIPGLRCCRGRHPRRPRGVLTGRCRRGARRAGANSGRSPFSRYIQLIR